MTQSKDSTRRPSPWGIVGLIFLIGSFLGLSFWAGTRENPYTADCGDLQSTEASGLLSTDMLASSKNICAWIKRIIGVSNTPIILLESYTPETKIFPNPVLENLQYGDEGLIFFQKEVSDREVVYSYFSNQPNSKNTVLAQTPFLVISVLPNGQITTIGSQGETIVFFVGGGNFVKVPRHLGNNDKETSRTRRLLSLQSFERTLQVFPQ